MKYSICNKILSGYVIFGAISLILINTLISNKVWDDTIETEASKLYSQANSSSTYYSNNYYNVSDNGVHNYANDMSIIYAPSDTSVWIVDSQNELLYSSNESTNPKTLPELSNYFNDTYYVTGDYEGNSTTPFLSVYSPIVNNYQYYGCVVVNKDLNVLHNEHTAHMNTINIVFMCMFGISLIIFVIFYFSIYKPLLRITTAAKEYAKGNYEYEGLNINSHDEIKNLADSLNFMAGSFKNLYSAQKKFIANISHDFRSPLTSIKGYVNAMLDGTIPIEAQERYLNIVLTETERLTKLTGSLLTLNTFDSNGMLLQLTNFDFTQIAMDTIASFEGQCSAKNIKIKLTHEDKPYMVSADQLRIQQVIYNLIDNAIKFSPNNADLIVDLSDKGDKVFVSVKDFGVGISPENQVKIFDRFYKVDDSRGKDKKGTGLGLAIVKEIITAHNENINVISTEGVGTQFVFSLAKAKK